MVLVEIVLVVLGGFSSVLGYVIVDEYLKHRREYNQLVIQVEGLHQQYGTFEQPKTQK